MTKQILAFLFCFIRELNIYTPLISILPPTYPPIPPPLNGVVGAFITLGAKRPLPEAVKNI